MRATRLFLKFRRLPRENDWGICLLQEHDAQLGKFTFWAKTLFSSNTRRPAGHETAVVTLEIVRLFLESGADVNACLMERVQQDQKSIGPGLHCL